MSSAVLGGGNRNRGNNNQQNEGARDLNAGNSREETSVSVRPVVTEAKSACCFCLFVNILCWFMQLLHHSTARFRRNCLAAISSD